MNLPIENRVIGKAKMPVFEKDATTVPHADQLEYMVKQKLSIGFAQEFLKKVGIEKIGAVGNEYEVEYVMEAYVFTREQLSEFIRDVERRAQPRYYK